uniref:(California timema) hypothetical protein n=1 Tax=Timema californicum TaxID=61474 RepID=A0A7R9PBC8_TIMCA|nr:unnamed protein product [Timema californicum]
MASPVTVAAALGATQPALPLNNTLQTRDWEGPGSITDQSSGSLTKNCIDLRDSSPVASLVLTDSSQLTYDSQHLDVEFIDQLQSRQDDGEQNENNNASSLTSVGPAVGSSSTCSGIKAVNP